MILTLKYMGQLRHLTGKNSEQIECPEGASLVGLINAASKNYDARFANIILNETGVIRPSMIIIINDTTAGKDDNPNLSNGDTITLLTAIAGG